MGKFVGLTCVEGGELEGSFEHHFNTITGAMRILKTERVCASAGDAGAVTVWKDDVGAYRCRFSQHRGTVNEECYGTKSQVARWLKDWFPKCYGSVQH